MKRIAIIFILWGRKHYDKATLSLINDFYYQKDNVKNYFEMKCKHFSSITEKKLEIYSIPCYGMTLLHISMQNR